jgi:hypothetical protein
MRALVVAISAAALLAGCSTEMGDKRVAAQSPAYQQGWSDGCESGVYRRDVEYSGTPQASDRFTRNEERFRTDHEYARGWNDGETSCAVGRPGRTPR